MQYNLSLFGTKQKKLFIIIPLIYIPNTDVFPMFYILFYLHASIQEIPNYTDAVPKKVSVQNLLPCTYKPTLTKLISL
jgi:hypothetical protein